MPLSVERSFHPVQLDKCPVSLAKPDWRRLAHTFLGVDEQKPVEHGALFLHSTLGLACCRDLIHIQSLALR